jgi:hypothetical protein
MAQVNLRSVDAITLVGRELTFATLPTMEQAYPVADSVEPDFMQTEVEAEDESLHLYDAKNPVLGMKDGSVKLSTTARPPEQLDDNAGLTSWQDTMLLAAFDGVAEALGGEVDTGSSATAFTVAADGSNYPAGTWIGVSIDTEIVPARVATQTGESLTVAHSLGGTPVNGVPVINSHTYYPAPSGTRTLAVQHAKAGDSSYQWQALGCIPELAIKLDRNGLVQFDWELKAATHSGPSAHSVDISTYTADPMGRPWAVKDAVCLLQATGTTSRTHYPVRSIGVKMSLGKQFLEELGGTEGKTGVMRVGQRVFAEIALRFVADRARHTDWSSRTDLQFVAMFPQGSGLSKRWFIVDAPKVVIVGQPKTTKDGGVMVTDVTLRTKINTSGTTDLARAPLRLAFI